MLKQRVITAIVLAALFIGTLYSGSYYLFAALCAVFVLAASWEWSRLSGVENIGLRVLFVLVVAGLAYLATWYTGLPDAVDISNLRQLLAVGCVFWAVSVLWLATYPNSQVLWGSTAVRLLIGVLILIVFWLAVLYLRSMPQGTFWVVFVLSLVAMADIGAYFVGKAIGKHKLAPSVSPGKSWEGFGGGISSAVLLAVILYFIADLDLFSLPQLLLISVLTALASVQGDLFESMIKRRSGFKDSGNLLPGHGGVMDRLDGLCAAVPIFALCCLLVLNAQ